MLKSHVFTGAIKHVEDSINEWFEQHPNINVKYNKFKKGPPAVYFIVYEE